MAVHWEFKSGVFESLALSLLSSIRSLSPSHSLTQLSSEHPEHPSSTQWESRSIPIAYHIIAHIIISALLVESRPDHFHFNLWLGLTWLSLQKSSLHHPSPRLLTWLYFLPGSSLSIHSFSRYPPHGPHTLITQLLSSLSLFLSLHHFISVFLVEPT